MAKPSDNLRVDGARLWESIQEMAEIGPGVRGGNNRQTLTDADREGRQLFQEWCEEAGLTVKVDQMGTMFCRRAGLDDTLPPVLVGSHLDTQPTGGRYDGVLGVLGGLEVIRTLNDLDMGRRYGTTIFDFASHREPESYRLIVERKGAVPPA